MAINTQKLLQQANTTSTSIALPPQDKKNVNTIRVRTIQVDKILKGTLAADKKRLTDKKKEASKQRKEDIETNLEKKPDSKGSKKITMPKILPKTGILDWIKNYIGNILLGYFAVRMLKHLPALKNFFTGIMAVGEFIIEWGGKILNGLVTFVDWGYKAYDATLGFIKTVGGDGLVSLFTKFSGVVDVVITTLIAATIAVAAQGDQVSDLLEDLVDPKKKPKGPKPKGPKPKPKGPKMPKLKGSNIPKLKGSNIPKPKGLKMPKLGGIPKAKSGGLLGLLLIIPTLFEVGGLFSQGYHKTAINVIISTIAGIVAGGAASSAAIAGAAALGVTGVGIPAAIALTIASLAAGGVAGWGAYELTSKALKAMGLRDNDAPAGYAKGGKVSKKASRTFKTRRQKKLVRAPHIPVRKVEPGKNVPGTITDDKGKQESKIFGLFPNPFAGSEEEEKTHWDPLDFIAERGDKFSEMGYFGPIASLSLKSIVGQKPDNNDYENAARGLSALRSSRTLGFSSGGIVDQEIVEKEWLKDELKKSFTPLVDKTLDEIKSNLELDVGDVATGPTGPTGPSGPTGPTGPGGGVFNITGGNADFWLLVAAGVFENSHPQGAADVAQAIYNRVHMPGDPWETGGSVRTTILNPGQFQPVRQYGGTAEWNKIRDEQSALAHLKKYRKTKGQLDRVAAALLDKSKQDSARDFVGPRDSFRSVSYEAANDHLAADTEAARHGHVFGFEPKGAMYESWKDGKLTPGGVISFGDAKSIPSTASLGLGDPNAGAKMAGDMVSREGVTDAESSLDVSNLGGKKRIYLHWSVTPYDRYGALSKYNVMYSKAGERHVSSRGLTANGHTAYRRDGIGLAASAMGGALENNFGSYPITSAQMWAMATDAATLANAMGYSNVTDKQVQTHGEAGSGTADNDELNRNRPPDYAGGAKHDPDNYGPSLWGGLGARWDLDKLEAGAAIGTGGPIMRKMINSKLKEYWKGGYTKGSKHQITVGERGKEFVMDADSTRALDDTFPGILSALNKADYSGTLKVLRNYAQYEVGGGGQSKILPVRVEVPFPVPVSGNGGVIASNSNGNFGGPNTQGLEKIG